MNYKKGALKRVFALCFEEKDDIVKELKKLCSKEKIKSGFFVIIGALEEASIIAGPAQITREKMPGGNILNLKDGMEILGAGTIFGTNKGAALHIHCAYGKKDGAFCGCLKSSKVYITVEGFLFETDFKGPLKNKNNPYGINLLDLN